MDALQIFSNPEFGNVRVVMRGDEPWFVAKDVAEALGYANTKEAIIEHCKHAELLKGSGSLPFTTSPRGINIIPEGDVYRLIMRSKLPEAEKFEVWVMEEVLPSIRKTGKYEASQEQIEQPVQKACSVEDLMTATRMILETAGFSSHRVALGMNNAFIVEYGRNPLALSGENLIAESKEQLLTPTAVGKQLVPAKSGKWANAWLCANGYQIAIRDGKKLKYEPTEAGTSYCEMVEETYANGLGTSLVPRWFTSIIPVIQANMEE